MTKEQERKLLKEHEDMKVQIAKLMSYKENNQLDKHTYTVKEVASLLHKSEQAIYGMIYKGKLETVNDGKVKVLSKSLKRVMGY